MAWLYLPVRVPSFCYLLPNVMLVCSYIRILKSPALYSVGVDHQEQNGALVQKRTDIAHSAAVLLEKCQLIKYELIGIPNAGRLVHRLIHSFPKSLSRERPRSGRLDEWPSHRNFKFSPRYSSSVAPRRLRTDIVTSARPFDMD